MLEAWLQMSRLFLSYNDEQSKTPDLWRLPVRTMPLSPLSTAPHRHMLSTGNHHPSSIILLPRGTGSNERSLPTTQESMHTDAQ